MEYRGSRLHHVRHHQCKKTVGSFHVNHGKIPLERFPLENVPLENGPLENFPLETSVAFLCRTKYAGQKHIH